MSSDYEYDVLEIAGSGEIAKVIAGETLGNRVLVYLNADGRYYIADASVTATMPAVGITMHASAAGFPVTLLLRGYIGDVSTPWAWTTGSELYASDTAGGMGHTAGTIAQQVGVAISATQIWFNPQAIGAGASGCAILEGATAFVGFDECKEPFTNYFLCDGVADDVQIQAAMNYVGALGGGRVILENDTYWISSALVIPDYSGITLQGQNMQTTILRATAGSVHNIIERTAGADIFFFTLKDLHLYGGNQITSGNGIHVTTGLNDLTLDHVRVSYCYDGIHVDVWGLKAYHLVAEHNTHNGIYVRGTQNHLLECYSADNDYDGFTIGQDTSLVSCYSYGNGRYGIIMASSGNEVLGGHTYSNYLVEAGTKAEIYVNGDFNRVQGVYIDGAGVSNYGLRLSAGADDNSITDNVFIDPLWFGIYNEGARNLIKENIGGTLSDVGTDTKLATKTFQFIAGGDVEGTAIWASFVSATASAKGWSVTGADDWAVALSQLPLELQQIVRFKIWAVALGAPIGGGGQMHLEIIMNAGADDLAFTTEPVALANFDSVTTDYVNTDVIHWVVDSGDDADIGHMVGGMSLEVKVIYETGDDPDGATNAVFRTVEVEYV